MIIFDFHGTLAYFKQLNFNKFLLSLENFGVKVKNRKEFESLIELSFFTKSWIDVVQTLLEKAPAIFVSKNNTAPKRKDIIALANFFKENIVFKLYNDTQEIMNLPFQKAILSNGPKFFPEISIKNTDLIKFTEVFTPCKTKFLKPDPRAFLTVLERFNVKPKQTVMVGDDMEKDIIPAEKLGIKAILIDRENKIKDYSGIKIRSLSELKDILV